LKEHFRKIYKNALHNVILEDVVRLKEKEFLEAFKEVFRYQLRRKFGLSNEMSTFEKCLRALIIPGYILLLYFFTHYNYEIPLTLLIFAGCAWLSETAMNSIKRIFHRRCELDKNHKGFREIKDFTFLEKLAAYLISAFILAVIFAGSLFLITFIRTWELNVKLFIGMLSIPVVLVYNLRKDKN
jgi:hypothetical protein